MSVQEAKKQAVQHYRAGSLKQALAAATRAAELDPRDAAIRNLAGAIAIEVDSFSAAVEHLSQSLAIDRRQASAHYLLGNALDKLELHEQAIDSYKESLAIDPNQPDALANLGVVQRKLQRYSDAERNLRMALDINPDHPEANNALAYILDSKSQPDRAEAYARRAVELDPKQVQFVATYGNILRNQRRYADAESVFRAALEYKPNDPSLLCAIGKVLREQNLFDKATEHYNRALELAPKSTTVLRNAADYFRSIRNNERSLEVYQKYVDLVGDQDVGAFNNMAITLRDLDRFDDAEEMYLKCIELDEDNSYGYNNLAILLMEMGNGKESIEYYQRALEQKPDYKGARSNMLFYMNYLSEYTPQELYEAHLEWQRYHVTPAIPGSVYHPNTPDPDRKLKIGYLSADFYGHAVSYFIEAALRYHNPDNVEITCYAHVATPDTITERLQGYVEQFRFIHHLKDNELADLIRDDEIDILVDLAGHTAGNRLDAIAQRPAPVQVTWIGYPNTTGLDSVDYRIVDEITDPEGLADETHTETLWRLPQCFTCYSPTAPEEVAENPPVVENGYITFGSFNNASKMSTLTVDAWSKVLHAVPDSKLLLKSASLADEGTCERFRTRFAERGIEQDRIELYGRLPSSEHMLFYNKVDIGLDPTPYNGTTTSCEALWMGVPIVTVPGNRHAARVTASLLHQVGLGDLAGETMEGFVETAKTLASDIPRLTKIRRELRENMRTSPLCDGPAHARDLEDAFRGMWRKWCEAKEDRKAERAANGWPADAPHRPKIRFINGMSSAPTLQMMRAIGVMKDTYLFSDIHPLGIQVFPPLQQATQWYELIDRAELDTLQGRNLSFEETFIRIYLNIADRGGTMVVRPWNHLDFVAVPFLPSPTYTLDTNEALEKHFEIVQTFMTRHPIGQWSDYINDTVVGQHIGPREFLRGYRKYVEIASEHSWFRIEDFHLDPDAMLRRICDDLEMDFDPGYVDSWFMNANVTGDPATRTISSRLFETFEPAPPAYLSEDDIDEIRGNADYKAIIEILAYDDIYPTTDIDPRAVTGLPYADEDQTDITTEIVERPPPPPTE